MEFKITEEKRKLLEQAAYDMYDKVTEVKDIGEDGPTIIMQLIDQLKETQVKNSILLQKYNEFRLRRAPGQEGSSIL